MIEKFVVDGEHEIVKKAVEAGMDSYQYSNNFRSGPVKYWGEVVVEFKGSWWRVTADHSSKMEAEKMPPYEAFRPAKYYLFKKISREKRYGGMLTAEDIEWLRQRGLWSSVDQAAQERAAAAYQRDCERADAMAKGARP